MKVSIIINTYNRMKTLPNTLSSLNFLRYPDLEVIVVDGPSTDGTLDYLKTFWSDKVKICVCAEANLSKSRNIGIANANGDIVCFIDDDGIAEPDWVDQLITAYDDPKVGGAGGWVRDHTGVTFQARYIISTRNSGSTIDIQDAGKLPACERHAEKFPGLIGVNSSFRRSILLEIGGFDEEYAYYLDETDVVVRVIDAGYQIRIVPNAEVHHKFAESHIRTSNNIARSWRQIMTSIAYYVLKNATPGTTLRQCLAIIDWYKTKFRRHTRYIELQGKIDKAHSKKLIDDLESGAGQGICDAFEYPCRRLLVNLPIVHWLPFPRPLLTDSRLRICFVSGLYPPRPCGGVASYTYNLARKLAERGHEITVITQAEYGRNHTVDFEEGVWVHRLPNDNSISAKLPIDLPDMPTDQRLFTGKVLTELDRVNIRRKFDYVIGSIWDLEIAAVIASNKYPVAMYLVTSYRLMEDSKREWLDNKLFYTNHVAKMIKAEAWALQNATQILTSSKAILHDIESKYNLCLKSNRVAMLPFGIPAGIQRVTSANALEKKIKILFVGRFEYRKGIDVLLAVVPDLLTKYDLVEVICIGDHTLLNDEGEPYIHKFLQQYSHLSWFKRIQFLGYVNNDTLEHAYSQCDIFVAPSRYESFGLIFLEAMRYAKPVIGTNIGGIPEVIQDNQTGLLVPPGDEAELSHAIQRLIEDTDLRHQLGEASFKRYQKYFTMDIFAHRFEKLIRTLIKDRVA